MGSSLISVGEPVPPNDYGLVRTFHILPKRPLEPLIVGVVVETAHLWTWLRRNHWRFLQLNEIPQEAGTIELGQYVLLEREFGPGPACLSP